MKKTILKLFINILAFFISVHLFESIYLDNLNTLIISGVVLWLVNLIIRPILLLISLPINLLTMGLFSIIINTWMILITDTLLKGIKIPNFWIALFISLFISVGNIYINNSYKNK
ncbi:MAG: phage holin family protein [Eubacteriaceae bacterium]